MCEIHKKRLIDLFFFVYESPWSYQRVSTIKSIFFIGFLGVFCTTLRLIMARAVRNGFAAFLVPLCIEFPNFVAQFSQNIKMQQRQRRQQRNSKNSPQKLLKQRLCWNSKKNVKALFAAEWGRWARRQITKALLQGKHSPCSLRF